MRSYKRKNEVSLKSSKYRALDVYMPRIYIVADILSTWYHYHNPMNDRNFEEISMTRQTK